MHQQQQPFFGWQDDNYIGSLKQHNSQSAAWHSFYSECRILQLVKVLFDRGAFSKADIILADLFCDKLIELIPIEPPALLHGDLWRGNYLISSSGYAAIFDPAVYYGHREMDIGMTCLFGGFDQRFYDGYQEIYPLENRWQQRLQVSQLYPLLVHAILFGTQYVESVKNILKKFS